MPGNMFWLRPKTFHNLLFDVYEAMRRRGFRAIVVLSGHWSIEHNVAAIRATGEEFRRAHPTTGWLLLTNQEVVPDRHYPVEHTAGGETSLLLAIHPNLIASTRRLSLTARCSLTTPINQDTWDGAARARTSTSASTQRLRTYRTIQKARRSSVAGRYSRPSSSAWRPGHARSWQRPPAAINRARQRVRARLTGTALFRHKGMVGPPFPAWVYSARMRDGRPATPVGDGKSIPHASRPGQHTVLRASSRTRRVGDVA